MGRSDTDEDLRPMLTSGNYKHAAYVLPNPEEFLHRGKAWKYDEVYSADVRERIMEFFKSYKIKARISGAKFGGSAAQYMIKLDPGVELKDLMRRQKDLKIRLNNGHAEISTPGDAAISIDVPEREMPEASLLDLLEHPVTRAHRSELPLVLGRTTDNVPALIDLTRTPHILVGGATGSGKSVCLNAIIHQLLLRFTPDQLKLTLVDTKKTEFTPFNGVPHLSPEIVVTSPHQAVTLLEEIDAEQAPRNDLLSKRGFKELSEYLKACRASGEEPEYVYRIVIIDEVADFITALDSQAAKQGIRSEQDRAFLALERISQTGRTAGIHLIMATQRPKAENLNTQIRSQLTVRIAFHCNDAPSSEQILGRGRTEAASLQGMGDAYVHLDDDEFRMRGAYVREDERNRLIKFWKDQSEE